MNGNESAFPYVITEDWKERSFGLTKREYFAAMAMAAMLSAPDNVADMDCDERADYASLNADFLLEALAKPKT